MKSITKCRVCLKNQRKDTFLRLMGDDNENAACFYSITGIIIVDLKENQPSVICKNCLKDLKNAAKFKATALKSEKLIKSITKEIELNLWNEFKKEDDNCSFLISEIILKQEHFEVESAKPEEFIIEQDNQDDSIGFDNFSDSFGNGSVEDKTSVKNNDDNFFENPEASTKKKRKYKPYKYSDKFKCWCGSQFTASKRLLDHKVAKHEDVPLSERPQCYICFKTFKIEAYLQIHMKSMHENKLKEETKQPCSICGMLLGRYSLKAHENRHKISTNKILATRFQCDHCNFSTSMKAYILNHLERVHLQLKKFKCRFCPAEFVHRSLLAFHKRKHLDLKTYDCKFCNKSFDRKYCCTIHERIHTNIRPYSCRFCDKTYIHHSDNRRHELKHTGGVSKKEFDVLLARGDDVNIRPVI